MRSILEVKCQSTNECNEDDSEWIAKGLKLSFSLWLIFEKRNVFFEWNVAAWTLMCPWNPSLGDVDPTQRSFKPIPPAIVFSNRRFDSQPSKQPQIVSSSSKPSKRYHWRHVPQELASTILVVWDLGFRKKSEKRATCKMTYKNNNNNKNSFNRSMTMKTADENESTCVKMKMYLIFMGNPSLPNWIKLNVNIDDSQ